MMRTSNRTSQKSTIFYNIFYHKRIYTDSLSISYNIISIKNIYLTMCLICTLKERKIDTYLSTSNNQSFDKSSQKSLNDSKTYKPAYNKDTNAFSSTLRQSINTPHKRTFNFKSLNELCKRIEQTTSKSMHEILQSMNFVGFVNRELALIQHRTALYLTNTRRLSEELFYQIALFNFGNFGYYKLAEPILISDLATMALENPASEWAPEDGPKERLASRCARFLKSKAKLLVDYFSVKIVSESDESGEKIYLDSLPILLDNYEPDLSELPLFIIRLATEVNWKVEKECFDSVCRQLGLFYSSKKLVEDSSDKKDEWITEHVLYTAIRSMLLVTEEYEKESFFKLVDLSRLYRVFERC